MDSINQLLARIDVYWPVGVSGSVSDRNTAVEAYAVLCNIVVPNDLDDFVNYLLNLMVVEFPGISNDADKLEEKERKFTKQITKASPIGINEFVAGLGSLYTNVGISLANELGWITNGVILYKLSDYEKQEIGESDKTGLNVLNISDVMKNAGKCVIGTRVAGYRCSKYLDKNPIYVIQNETGIGLVSAKMWETIVAAHPKSKPLSITDQDGKITNPIAFKENGDVVGVIMPMVTERGVGIEFKEAPVSIRPLARLLRG